ncbi:MAG TPA: hypothetical protein VMY37_04330 [Thermoguttaceae bacterium]|nr:hypothetical protein [Thermoguttaceae bacterium]
MEGVSVQVSPWLEGMKKAVRFGETIYVSPAMWDLLSHANPAELEHLVANIPVLDLGDIPFPFVRLKDLPSAEAC